MAKSNKVEVDVVDGFVCIDDLESDFAEQLTEDLMSVGVDAEFEHYNPVVPEISKVCFPAKQLKDAKKLIRSKYNTFMTMSKELARIK